MSDGINRAKLRLFRLSLVPISSQSFASQLWGLSYIPSLPVLLRLRRLLPSPCIHEQSDREYRRLLGLGISSFRKIFFKCSATFSQSASPTMHRPIIYAQFMAKSTSQVCCICTFYPIPFLHIGTVKSLKLRASILLLRDKLFRVYPKRFAEFLDVFRSQKRMVMGYQIFHRFQFGFEHTLFSFLRQYFKVLVLLLFVGSKVGFRRLGQANRLYILSHGIYFLNVYVQNLKNLISKSVKKTCQVPFFGVEASGKNFSFAFCSILLIFNPKIKLYQTISIL